MIGRKPYLRLVPSSSKDLLTTKKAPVLFIKDGSCIRFRVTTFFRSRFTPSASVSTALSQDDTHLHDNVCHSVTAYLARRCYLQQKHCSV